MKRNMIVILTGFCLFVAVPFQAYSGGDQCYQCHSGLGDKPSSLYAHDIHRQKGVTCADCHGGNPNTEDMEVAMATGSGFRGVPKGDDISKACASCHSNPDRMKQLGSSLPVGQWEMVQTSVHAKLTLDGKQQIAQCITCHGSHGIVRVTDKRSPVNPLNVVATCAHCHSSATFMRDFNPSLPIDQVEKYRTSVHGMLNAKGDPKPAECASCHGSHDIRSAKDANSTVYPVNLPQTCARCHGDAEYMKQYAIATDQMETFERSVHGKALLEKHDLAAPACNDCHGNHGAVPPGVESVSKVCGTCHALNADLFSSSPHKKAFDERKLPECETCHGNHEIVAVTEKLLGTGSEAICSTCHQPDKNQKGYVVAASMRRLTDSLDAAHQAAASMVEEAEQKGMEISEAKFKLRDARQARLQARTMVHSFNEEKFSEVVQGGLTIAGTVTGEAKAAIDEYYFRRWGLGISTLIISLVAVSLYLTIKRIERRQQEQKS